MDASSSIRSFEPAEWPTYRTLRLLALADSPDAFGSTLVREERGTDQEWAERLAEGVASSRSLPLLAEVGGKPGGLAWGRIEPEEPSRANLYQMWVSQDFRRHGLGRGLLAAVITWAEAAGAGTLELGVTRGDSAATRLYARAGFLPVGRPEPLRPGSALLTQRMVLALPS